MKTNPGARRRAADERTFKFFTLKAVYGEFTGPPAVDSFEAHTGGTSVCDITFVREEVETSPPRLCATLRNCNAFQRERAEGELSLGLRLFVVVQGGDDEIDVPTMSLRCAIGDLAH